MTRIDLQLERLHNGIRKDMDLVADFFDVNTSLKKYAEEIHNYDIQPVHVQRQELLKKVVRKQLETVFTVEEIESANIQWEKPWKLNIVDHHGILNHPILLSTNIIGNMHQLPSKKPEGVVVLSDSGVPLNNFFHKRGVKFQGRQLNIYPTRDRHVMAFAGKKRDHFPLVDAAQRQDFDGEKLDFLRKTENQLNTIAQHELCSNYRTQVQRINYTWWKKLFAEDIRPNVPDVLYVSNEDVGIGLLNEYLHDEENIFYRLLFNADVREIVIREFMNHTGCWDEDGKRGTVFFWAVDEHQRKVALRLDGNALVSEDGSVRVELTPDSVIEALNEERMYPNMFLVYGMANFYCGVRPLVGYGSMNYQTAMKNAWVRALKQFAPEEVDHVESVSTNGFIGGPMVTYGWSQETGYRELYALDIFYQGGFSREYLEHVGNMSFNAVLQPALIDIYESYVRPENKEEITITPNELMGESFSWLKDMQV